jgi:hypothetical protein
MDNRGARRKAALYRDAGRALLHEEGVLPWFLWPNGRVVVGWWNTRLFSYGLKVWYEMYVTPNREIFPALRAFNAAAVELAVAVAEHQHKGPLSLKDLLERVRWPDEDEIIGSGEFP